MELVKTAIIFFSCLLALHQCDEKATIISSHLGKISGTRIQVLGKSIDQYLGIPFSKPITSKYRFKRAQPVDQYDSIIKGDTIQPDCPQQSSGKYLVMDENCLFLNIWNPVKTSQDEAPKAVMFWIAAHGFLQHSEYFKNNNGKFLSSLGDVIFVSVNYRISSFGFLTTGGEEEPGNIAFYDQNLALQWVQENIAYFGGDPSRVTVFGKGEGSVAISYHILSGKSTGLFKRAILQSSSYYTPLITFRKQTAMNSALKLAQEVGCASPKENFRSHREHILKCMRNKRWQDILKAELELPLDYFIPLLGEEFMQPEDILKFPNNINTDVEVILGITKEEGNVMLHNFEKGGNIMNLKNLENPYTLNFAARFIGELYNEPRNIAESYFKNVDPKDPKELRTALSNVISDYYYSCPTVIFADSYSRKGGKVHFYYFTHYSSKHSIFPEWVGSSHYSDIFYTLGEPLNAHLKYTEQDVKFSKNVMRLWSDFAKGEELEEWSIYNSTSRMALELNPRKNSMVKIPRAQLCNDLWRPAFEEKIEDIIDEEELPTIEKILPNIPKYEF